MREREIKQLSTEEKYPVRQKRSVPILNELRACLDINIIVVPPRSALDKAMQYLHKQWDTLTIYTTDGRLSIDNNLCENVVRLLAYGQKILALCQLSGRRQCQC